MSSIVLRIACSDVEDDLHDSWLSFWLILLTGGFHQELINVPSTNRTNQLNRTNKHNNLSPPSNNTNTSTSTSTSTSTRKKKKKKNKKKKKKKKTLVFISLFPLLCPFQRNTASQNPTKSHTQTTTTTTKYLLARTGHLRIILAGFIHLKNKQNKNLTRRRRRRRRRRRIETRNNANIGSQRKQTKQGLLRAIEGWRHESNRDKRQHCKNKTKQKNNQHKNVGKIKRQREKERKRTRMVVGNRRVYIHTYTPLYVS